MASMKQDLTKIVDKKQEQKKNLHQLKSDYLLTIYKGLAKSEDVRNIHKKLIQETINANVQDKAMLNQAVRGLNILAKKTINKDFVKGFVKQSYGETDKTDIMPIFIFTMMKELKIENVISKEITRIADTTEADSKYECLVDSFKRNRKLDDPKIFYLASYHKDSATDHAKWQGKVYVDEDWESVPMHESVKEQVRTFIRKNNIKTVQWVTGKPVWFITRPNCRHYLVSLSTVDVLGHSRRFLLKKNNMKTAIGDRQYLQTISHSISKKWYEQVRNAELLLDKYEERLTLHTRMYEAAPNPLIAQAIRKDRELIQKWKIFIKEKKKSERR